MIDRRSFLICGAASAMVPPVDSASAQSATTVPDAWEKGLREMEMFIRILRENRHAIIALENNQDLPENARRNVMYVRSLTVDHCAKMIEHLVKETRRNADALLVQSGVNNGHIAGI